MAWKSIAKTVAIGLVIVAIAALAARQTDFGQSLFGTARKA